MCVVLNLDGSFSSCSTAKCDKQKYLLVMKKNQVFIYGVSTLFCHQVTKTKLYLEHLKKDKRKEHHAIRSYLFVEFRYFLVLLSAKYVSVKNVSCNAVV